MKQTQLLRQAHQMHINGRTVPVIIRTMERKSLRLGVTDKGEVEVRVPIGYRQADVDTFLIGHYDWLLQRLQQVSQRQEQRLSTFWHRGKSLPLVRYSGAALKVHNDVVQVPLHWNEQELLESMETWRRAFAKAAFADEIDRWWPEFQGYGVARPVLRVKKMRTRWGSLSSRGYINLNLALTQVHPELLELVVVHELCHIRYQDHGKGFQQLMSRHLPDWRQRDRLLDQAGHRLL